MIISFAWTTPALLAGRKTVTRRDWTKAYAHRFHAGELEQAWDRTPRIGGHQVAIIRLVFAPYPGHTGMMPKSDYEAEGFAYLEEQGLLCDGMHPRIFWQAWKAADLPLYVVRFGLESITPGDPNR